MICTPVLYYFTSVRQGQEICLGNLGMKYRHEVVYGTVTSCFDYGVIIRNCVFCSFISQNKTIKCPEFLLLRCCFWLLGADRLT